MLHEENIALYAFRKYGDAALREAYCLTRCREDAEDIAQEVFLCLHAYPQQFQDDAHLKAWILRAVINRCRNLHRSWWRQKRTDAEDVPESALAAPPEDPGGITEMIRALPKRYASVVYLHDYEGYTVKEIAGILRKKENTVSSLLRRGRERLRMELEQL